ncbi:MAG: ABC transporter permease [Elusimicrobia bacterium]|nr:ABC transporter permease [Elusimicrobiota bacterium]
MKAAELSRSALIEIRAHKTRSAMTSLSLAIGIAAMLFTFSQTAGMMKRYDDALRLAGPGRLVIKSRDNYVSKGLSPGLTYQDALEIRRQYPELFMVSPENQAWGTRVRLDDFKNDGIQALGVTPEWQKRDWVYARRGRFLNQEDLDSAARVCVLVEAGRWIKKPYWAKYFPEQALTKYISRRDPLGRRMLIGEHLFTVVGVLKEPPKDRDPRWFRSGGGEGLVLVPATAFHRFLTPRYQKNPNVIHEINVDTGDAATAAAYLRRVKVLLRARHRGEEDFEIKDFREIMQSALKQMKEFIISILIIGLIAIFASGIGIMNVTLATIFSRVREIGIRRALGATRADIVWQFVSEAMLLGVLGGLAGTVLGVLGIWYLAPREERMLQISPLHVSGALLIALGTGFIFALYPAWKASRLDPVESLHYE